MHKCQNILYEVDLFLFFSLLFSIFSDSIEHVFFSSTDLHFMNGSSSCVIRRPFHLFDWAWDFLQFEIEKIWTCATFLHLHKLMAIFTSYLKELLDVYFVRLQFIRVCVEAWCTWSMRAKSACLNPNIWTNNVRNWNIRCKLIGSNVWCGEFVFLRNFYYLRITCFGCSAINSRQEYE